MKFRELLAIGVFVFGGLIGALTQAQELPGRPIRLIVPYPPGAANDTAARLLAAQVQGLGSVIVENKPGGDATIGAEFVKQAPADGHTLLAAAQGYTIRAAMIGQKSLRYDIVRDFDPVIYIARVPFFLVVNKDVLAMNSPRELAEYRADTDGHHGLPGRRRAHEDRKTEADGRGGCCAHAAQSGRTNIQGMGR